MIKAIILAAGIGERLGPLTIDRPKCLLELRGKTIISRQLRLLEGHDVTDVTVVTGYLGETIRSALGERVKYKDFPGYAGTNNLLTLHHCQDLLEGQLVVLFSDVITEKQALGRCLASPHDFALLVDLEANRTDTMRVRLRDGLIVDIGGHIPAPEGDGNFIGIAKFSAKATTFLRAELRAMAEEGRFANAYYTQALPRIAALGQPVNPVPLDGARWFEIDTVADYEAACQESFYDV